MQNRNTNSKSSLNKTIVNVVIFICWVVLISIIISSSIIWRQTSDFVYILLGIIGVAGISLNIYLLSKEK
jgi:hypothetical protein